MDPVNRVIWITPVIKASYTNNAALVIETRGLGIQNPISSSTINVNTFTIRYYTWPSWNPTPTIAISD